MNHFKLLTTSLGLVCAFSACQTQAQSVDLGDASVLSQQGQRLKLAVPFGSEPGANIPLLRFQVQSVEAGEGQRAPSAKGFTISKPENRNVIFLQSEENVSASNLKLVLAVADGSGKRVAYDIVVPPASASTVAVASQAAPAPKMSKAKKSKRLFKAQNKAQNKPHNKAKARRSAKPSI